MSMGSYRQLRNERTVTVEKLESTVAQQLAQPEHDPISEAKRQEPRYNKFGADQTLNDLPDDHEDDEQKENPNAMPFGMDNRPAHVKAAAAMHRDSSHRKIPTFGHSANLQGISSHLSADEETGTEPDDESEEENDAPQQFPKMEMSQQYMPGAPKMQKDYDPLSGLNSSEQPGGNGNGSNSNDEGGDEPGGVS